MKTTQQKKEGMSKEVDTWIAEEELPSSPFLKRLKTFDPYEGMDDDEIEAYREFRMWYLTKDFALLMTIPKPEYESDFWKVQLDEGGNDTYNSVAHSLGGGNECGIGIVVDYAGDDNYLTTHSGSMGNGYFSDGRKRGSWGVFLDLGGTDTYTSEKQSQGCNNNSTWTINDIGAGGDFDTGIVIWQ